MFVNKGKINTSRFLCRIIISRKASISYGNITFYFECYLHHDCSVNLNWNNTQLYSSAKPLRNVPNSVFWFVNFCFLPFLRRTSVQKWKKNWVCYIHKWIGKKGFLFAEALNFSQGSKYDSFLSTSRLK